MQLLSFESLAFTTCQAYVIELAMHVERNFGIYRYYAILTLESLNLTTAQEIAMFVLFLDNMQLLTTESLAIIISFFHSKSQGNLSKTLN